MFEVIEKIEQAILQFLIDLHTPFLDKIMIFITSLANNGELWIVVGLVLLLFKKHRKAGLTVLAALVFMYLLNDLFLKNVIARVRPFYNMGVDILIDHPDSYSFPSGHTASSFAAAFVLFKYYKKYAILIFSAASLMAFTRLYLTVHYPSDILAGIIVGYLCATAGIYVIDKLYTRYNKSKIETKQAA